MTQDKRAYGEGFYAAFEGTANPYPTTTARSNQWEYGFKKGCESAKYQYRGSYFDISLPKKA